jgi:hypothetical protein
MPALVMPVVRSRPLMAKAGVCRSRSGVGYLRTGWGYPVS